MANVTPQAYRNMIGALDQFIKSMQTDAEYLTKSAAILHNGMNGDTISSRLKIRVDRSAKEIGDLCASAENFKKALEEELEMILEALRHSDSE